MKISTIEKKRTYYLLSVFIWIIIWYILSLIVGEEIFLPSPVSVMHSLLSLLPTSLFWRSVLFSVSRVILGITLAFLCGFLTALISSFNPLAEIFLSPLVKAVRSIPVASVIILILLWVKSRNLSAVVSFFMVFPIIYSSVLSGMKNTSPLLLEMAENYSVIRRNVIRYIYMPSLFPYIRTGLSSAVGLAWKSAVAAEVIGLPRNSVGSMLYESKIYLLTADLFAWTAVTVLLSFIFEKLVFFLLSRVEKAVLK